LLTYPLSKERGFTVRKRVVALPWDVKSALANISALHPRTKVQGFAPIFHKKNKHSSFLMTTNCIFCKIGICLANF